MASMESILYNQFYTNTVPVVPPPNSLRNGSFRRWTDVRLIAGTRKAHRLTILNSKGTSLPPLAWYLSLSLNPGITNSDGFKLPELSQGDGAYLPRRWYLAGLAAEADLRFRPIETKASLAQAGHEVCAVND